jgi:AAA domain
MNSPQPKLVEAPVESSLLAGVNVLLEGPTGTGKTYSIGTLVDTGVETFYVGLESGIESLIGYWTDRGLAIPENLHWHTMFLSTGGFSVLADAAKTIGDSTQESLYKMLDYGRGQNNYFEKFLRIMVNFKDQRTDKEFGSVDKWGPDRALVIDSLTGLGNCALNMVVGKKPMVSPPDWGLAMSQVEKTLRTLCDGAKCHFVLLSHVEREIDEVMGGTKVTVSTLGKKLPPKIPPMFSDAILAVRTGTSWSWSTANTTCDLKSRNLPIAENIEPSFKAIISKWKSRGGRFSPTVKS